MPNTVNSPNMGIVVPVVLTDPGPDWATRIFTALNATIDAHDHSSGKGVQVPSAGIGINADLPFASFNATGLRSTRYASQASPLALGADVGCLSNVLGDAYWNNGSGTAIQLTKNGLVNATFTGYAARLNVTGSVTILSTDTTQLFLVNATAAVTINLPASSLLTAGRFYVFQDYLGLSEGHPVTFVPNGADTVNGVNASFTWAQKKGSLFLTTDAAGNWYPTYTSENYEQSTGIVFPASLTASVSQAQQANASNPISLTIAPQAPGAGAASTGTGTPGSLLLNYAAPVSTGAEAGVKVQRAGTTQLRVGNVSFFPAVHLGSAGDAPTINNYHLLTSDGVTLFVNSAGSINFANNNAVQANIGSGTLNFPSGITLQNAGSGVAAITSGGLAITSSAGPTITSGTGAPASSPPNGSIYLRTDGAGSTTVYERQGGAWTALVSGLSAPVTVTTRTVTTNTSYDATTPDTTIITNQAGAITITLPTPTNGRTLFLIDKSGNANTNNITLARASTEKINGLAASLVLNVNNGFWTIMSDGTDWYVS